MSLERALETIQHQYKNLGSRDSAYTPHTTLHIFSNQAEVRKQFFTLEETPTLKVPNKDNMAILVGESSFLSFAPVLVKHVDTVLLLDIDARVLSHNLFMLNCLKKANSREEFSNMVLGPDNPIVKLKAKIPGYNILKPGQCEEHSGKIIDLALYESNFNSSFLFLVDRHFLYTKENFFRVKEAVMRLKFLTLEVDFFNTTLMSQLGKTLLKHNVYVPVINVSNLYDYDGKFALREATRDKLWFSSRRVYETLQQILSHPEECLILYGITNPEDEYQSLTSRVCKGLRDYEHATTSYSTAVNATLICRHHKLNITCKPEPQLSIFFNSKGVNRSVAESGTEKGKSLTP